jgi:glycopeptide antibiotics resistance protein
MPVVLFYMGYLLTATLHPFELSPELADRFSQFFFSFVPPIPRGGDHSALVTYPPKIFLFVPLGFFLYFALERQQRPRVRTILLASIWGGMLAFFFESCQLLVLYRHASAFDFFIKSFGAFCGTLVASFFPVPIVNEIRRLWTKLERLHIPLAMAGLYALLPCIFLVARYPWFNFRNWNHHFTLQMANEATWNKPWLGEIYLIAVYSQALSPDEIARHFRLGFSLEALGKRVRDGIVALYTFHEASGTIIHDSSTPDSPVDLILSSASAIRWLGVSNGIEIREPAIIQSRGPATKLYTALKDMRSLSIEAWIRPANPSQTGAARIISFAGDIQNANFMVGQHASELVFWLRTALSGERGTALQLETQESPLGSETVHIVATYQDRQGKIYVNGRESSGGVDLATDVIVGFNSRKIPIAQIAYSFFYFFPLSFFLARWLSTRSRSFGSMWVLPTALAAGLLALTETSQALIFHRSLDLYLISYGILIALLGACSGVASSERDKIRPVNAL